ncbi:hypothetical protein F7725_010103 [Dissostichus mawsoni]|uniref:Uncharacterized protein n=1 Tax=Dissostichus mawsoni TaxID=36200 RepID=A0A7J5XMK6_DISMA|nr:hypothetical protein F7725_010103 [Dissostichus mawsoni]
MAVPMAASSSRVVVIIGALYLLKLPSVLWHLTAIKLMRLSRKITDTDTMAISRYRFKSEKLSSFVGTSVLSTTTTSIDTVADREGSPLSETNTTKGPDFSATGSNPEEVVSFGLREVIRKQRIVSRVCVYSPDLCHKVSRLSRIGDALTVNGAVLRIGRENCWIIVIFIQN